MVTGRKLAFKVLILVPVLMAALVIVACGSAAAPAQPASPAAEVQAPVQESAQPTAIPQQQAAPQQTSSGKDEIVIVMAAEPGSVDPWNPTCNATLDTAVCNEIVNEPMTWITSDTYEVVTLSGVEGWKQVDARIWDFTLRQGVKVPQRRTLERRYCQGRHRPKRRRQQLIPELRQPRPYSR